MRLRCLDLTGTGMVGRDGAFGISARGPGSGCGSITGSEWIGMIGGADGEQALVAACPGWEGTEFER